MKPLGVFFAIAGVSKALFKSRETSGGGDGPAE